MKRSILLILVILSLLMTACGAPEPPEARFSDAPAQADNPEIIDEADPVPEAEPVSEPGTASKPKPKSGKAYDIGICMFNRQHPAFQKAAAWMKEQLEAKDYRVDLCLFDTGRDYAEIDKGDLWNYWDNYYASCPDYPEKLTQVQSDTLQNMVDEGCKIIIVSPDQFISIENLIRTMDAGVTLVQFNCPSWVGLPGDYFIYYQKRGVGIQQARYIIDQLDLDHSQGKTYNIEFLRVSGANDDVFETIVAEDMLQPYIDVGVLQIPSGRVEYDTAVRDDAVQDYFEALLSDYYSDGTKLDVVLAANDYLAAGAIKALETTYQGDQWPIVVGSWGTYDAIENILAGKQSMTVIESYHAFAEKTVEVVDQLMRGIEPETPAQDSRPMDIPLATPMFSICGETDFDHDKYGGNVTCECDYPIVTIDNYRELLIDTGCYTEEQLADVDIETE